MTRYETQTIGFKPETTYGVDPITLASTQYWKFGKYTIPWGSFPMDKRTIQSMFTGAGVMPQQNYFTKFGAVAGLSTPAVNAIPLYYALGKVTNTGAGDPYSHKIEPRDVGSDLPSFTMRSEDANNSVGIYKSVPGCYIQALTVVADLDPKQVMTYNTQIVGQKESTPQFAGASDSGSLVFAGSHDKQYRFDTNTVAKWDATFASGVYSSGGDDITNEMVNFALTISNSMVDDTPQGQSYPDNYLIGYADVRVTFALKRYGSTTKNIYDDFITMQDNSTTKNMHFKIHQGGSANHYLQFDLSNITLEKVERNNTLSQENEEPIFDCVGVPDNLIITAQDPLAGATYYA